MKIAMPLPRSARRSAGRPGRRAFRPDLSPNALEGRQLPTAVFTLPASGAGYGPTVSTVVCNPNQATNPGTNSSVVGETFTNSGAGTFGGNGDTVTTSTNGTTSVSLSVPTNSTSGTAGVTFKSAMQAEAQYSATIPNSNVVAGAATRLATGGNGNDNFNNLNAVNPATYNFGVADSSGNPVTSGSVSFSFSAIVQPPGAGVPFNPAPVVINVTTNYYTIVSPDPTTGRGIAVFLGAGTGGTKTSYGDPNFGGGAGQDHTFTATLPNLALATAGNFVTFGSSYGIGFNVPAGPNQPQSGNATDELSFNYGETIQSSTDAQPADVASGAAGPAILIPLELGSSAATAASVQPAVGAASPARAGYVHRAASVVPSLGTSEID